MKKSLRIFGFLVVVFQFFPVLTFASQAQLERDSNVFAALTQNQSEQLNDLQNPVFSIPEKFRLLNEGAVTDTNYNSDNIKLARYVTKCRPDPVYSDRTICESVYESDTPAPTGPCTKPVGMGLLFSFGFGVLGAIFAPTFLGIPALTGAMAGAAGGFVMGYALCKATQ